MGYIFKIKLDIFMCRCVLPVCMFVPLVNEHLMPTEHRREYWTLWSRVTGCELPCECRESNPGLLEEYLVLLTAKPSLQSRGLYLKY